MCCLRLTRVILQEIKNKCRVWNTGSSGNWKHTVYFEGHYIVYDGNKRRTKLKEMKWRKNELI